MRLPKPGTEIVEIQHCLVADYLVAQEAADLRLGTWCNQPSGPGDFCL